MTEPADARLEAWESVAVDDWRHRWDLPSLNVLAETTSTNDVLRSMADAGAKAGTVVIAEHQSAGRGQAGRRWESASGQSLLLSVLLRSDAARGQAPDPSTTPIRVGLAVCKAIARVSGVTARLKWPNDIVFDGRKLAGILCEGASGASGTFVVAGIGINVRQAKEDLPLDLRTPGTSLRIITGRETARPELASALLDALRPFRLRGEIGPDTLAEYRTYDALLGRIVTLDDGTTGTARGIDANGALLFETDEGIRTLRSGSVRTFTQHSTTGLP